MKKIIRFTLAVGILFASLHVATPADAATTQRSYQYDASGRLQSMTLPGYKITFSYDKNGNLLKRSVTAAAK